jgi:hypothetical protein
MSHRSGSWVSVLLVLCGLAVGCNSGSTPTKKTENADPAGNAKVAETPANQGFKDRAKVESYPGNWALVITQQIPDQRGAPTFRDLYITLIQIEASTDGPTLKVLASLENAPKFESESITLEDQTCVITLKANGNPFVFRGTLKDGAVRGTVALPGNGVAPAYLRPTEETEYRPQVWDPTPPAFGGDLLVQAFQQKDLPGAVFRVAEELKGTPLSVEAYGGIFNRLQAFPNLDEAGLRAAGKAYLASAEMWGPLMVTQARVNLALSAASVRRYPQVALDWLDELDQHADDETKTGLAEPLQAARYQARIDLALVALKGTDKDEQAKANATLEELLPVQRYNPEVLYALGMYASQHEQAERAIEHLGDIVALPLLEGMWERARVGLPPGDLKPRDELLKLWEAKHGNLDAFDGFLKETYDKRMVELAEAVHKKGPALPEDVAEGTHGVLVELFTGAVCPPCISGDVALGIVEHDFPAPRLIAIRYHQHIPGPDPLANQDGEDRFGYYEGQGTPYAVIDGLTAPNPGVGGMLQHVERAYSVFRAGVDQRLKTKNDVQLVVTAIAADGELKVEAEATGWPEELKSLRLRLALVEDQIEYLAPNGMRTHERVVREMIGGPKGIGIKAGKLKQSTQTPLAELRQRLTDYLEQFEANRSVDFPIKPLTLKPLSVVAWVQNDETREILQTVIVPVSGDLPDPPATQPAPAPPETTKPDETKPKVSQQETEKPEKSSADGKPEKQPQ